MTEIIIAGIFLLFIFLREKQHTDEVKLLSRSIIAKNVYEISDSEKQEGDTIKEGNKKPIIPEVENLTDEEFMASIHKQLGRESKKEKFTQKITKKLWPKQTLQE